MRPILIVVAHILGVTLFAGVAAIVCIACHAPTIVTVLVSMAFGLVYLASVHS